MQGLAKARILRRAKTQVESFRRNASGIRFWLHYCAQFRSPELCHGVFVRAHPDRIWVKQLYLSFAEWLIQGRHRKELNKVTGEYEKSPVCPSTIMAIYSLALFPNKLFGRDVVGLPALQLVREHARDHIPQDKIYLSKANLLELVHEMNK